MYIYIYVNMYTVYMCMSRYMPQYMPQTKKHTQRCPVIFSSLYSLPTFFLSFEQNLQEGATGSNKRKPSEKAKAFAGGNRELEVIGIKWV